MEISLISLDGIKALKKKRGRLWGFLGGLAALLAAFVGVAYAFQTRATQNLWIGAGAMVTAVILIIGAYVIAKMLTPLNHYLAFSIQALSSLREVDDVRLDAQSLDVETFRGFPTKQLFGYKVDEGSLLRYRYEATAAVPFLAGKVYEIEAFDEVIVRLKEKP